MRLKLPQPSLAGVGAELGNFQFFFEPISAILEPKFGFLGSFCLDTLFYDFVLRLFWDLCTIVLGLV